MPLTGVDMDGSSGEGVGGTVVDDEGAGARLMALSSSAGCEAVCVDKQVVRTRPQNQN